MEAVDAELVESQLPAGAVVRLNALGHRARATVEHVGNHELELRLFEGLADLADLPDGTELELERTLPQGVLTARVESIRSRSAESTLWVTMPSTVSRTQRREFYRVSVALPVGIITDHRTGTVLGHTVDVSAGGMALRLDNSDMEMDELGEVWLRLPEGPPVRATAVVVGTGEVYRVRFTGINFADRERLARFTLRFDAVRRSRKRHPHP
jgi:hypothetical protein